MSFGEIGGGTTAVEQSVNVNQVNGQAISTSNPLPVAGPVTSTDGGLVTIGSMSDTAYSTGSGTVIALLKAVYGKLAGTLTTVISGTVTVQGVSNGVAQPISGTVTVSNVIAISGAITLTSPPTATSAAADTSLTFSQRVNRIFVQNNSGSSVNMNFDAAASGGTYLLTPGSSLLLDLQLTVLHLYTATAININGTSGGNIVVGGWL